MASVTCVDTLSSIMLLGAACIFDPGGRSWVPGSYEPSYQASLGRGIIEDELRCQYFARMKFSCVSSSEFSYTRLFQFTGTVSFLM